MNEMCRFNLRPLLGQPSRVGRSIRYIIAGFYIYGAAVHAANMLSLPGFDWSAAPLK